MKREAKKGFDEGLRLFRSSPAGPAMAQRPLRLAEVGRHRHHDCDHYDQCLDMASRSHWEGWSCQGCEPWNSSKK